MAVIGNSSTQQAFTPAIDYFSGNASTTAFTLSRPVASVAQIQVVIDNVAQNPSSAYTVSANTITFTSAPLSGTNNIYVYYTSPITQVIAPGQGTVTTTSLASSLTLTTPTLTSPIITGSTPQFIQLTTGSGTYTTPTNARYLLVKMVGGGGGGGGGGNNGTAGNGGVGGSTTFGTSLLTCTGGQGTTTGSSGGTATLNSPAIGIANTGNKGGGFGALVTSAVYLTGGTGASSPFGGCGTGAANDTGQAAQANSGSGGGGGGNNGSQPAFSGGGGGSAGYIEAIINSPSASYSYSIGAGGTAGTAGTNGFAGGAGGSGIIYVFAFF